MNDRRPPDVGPVAPPRDIGRVADGLAAWMAARAHRSWDPYDGLTAPLFAPVRRVPPLARLCLQLVKRSPWNLRPLLGIRPRLYTKTISDLLAACCVDPDAPESVETDIRRWADSLVARRLPAGPGACWGMDLPYASRFTVATPDTPNLFQTVNAVLALLDAQERTGEATYGAVAAQVVPFLEEGLGRVCDTEDRILWRYYPGDNAVVYNVNALIAMALMRLARATHDASLAATARATMHAVVGAQNEDGSWWYAADARGHWVDGFHSGYVLESLLVYLQDTEDDLASNALQRGMGFFRDRLLERDGLPRYLDRRRYPIDVQNCAQAVQLMARWSLSQPASAPEPQPGSAWTLARAVFEATCRELLVVDTPGPPEQMRLHLSRGRWWTNELAAIRWGLAPMLLALRWLQRAERRAQGTPAASDS